MDGFMGYSTSHVFFVLLLLLVVVAIVYRSYSSTTETGPVDVAVGEKFIELDE